jgi:hypothetical protein
MADKILSAITYDTVTKSYANVPVAQAPLLVNDNGDLIFNTQNLSLYNVGSNNRILKNDYTPQYTDNVLIGSENAYIYGQPHTIINSCNSYISGNRLLPDGTVYSMYNTISNTLESCIVNSTSSNLDSSFASSISGSEFVLAQNTWASKISNVCTSTIIGGGYHRIDGTWVEISTTGKITPGIYRAGFGSMIGGGFELKTLEANFDKSRFNEMLGGTGWANGNSSNYVYFNMSIVLLGGCCNTSVTSNGSSIIGGECNFISGTTNGAWMERGGARTIARWKLNQNNSIIASKNSKILDQVSESIILGGSNNCIVGRDFPWYYSGIDKIDPYPYLQWDYESKRIVYNANIIGGKQNKICTASYGSSIIGSDYSTIESGSCNSIILGGCRNSICSNSNFSFIGGGACSIIQNSHSGAAVLGDGQDRTHLSCGSHTLTLNFANGVYFAQTGIFGQTNFSTRPKVNSIDILVNGDTNLVYNTGNQTIAGIKNFTSRPNVNNISILVSGDIKQIFTSPASANSAGISGQFVIDGDYFYFCKKDNTWVRTALSSW